MALAAAGSNPLSSIWSSIRWRSYGVSLMKSSTRQSWFPTSAVFADEYSATNFAVIEDTLAKWSKLYYFETTVEGLQQLPPQTLTINSDLKISDVQPTWILFASAQEHHLSAAQRHVIKEPSQQSCSMCYTYASDWVAEAI